MKRYVVFAYSNYYPSGGLKDVAESYDSLEEAQGYKNEWDSPITEIVDRDTWEVLSRVEG